MRKINENVPSHIQAAIRVLFAKDQLEPVVAIFPDKRKIELERIAGTTKYFINEYGYLLDVSFAKLYNHDGIIPNDCMVLGDIMLRIEKTTSVSTCAKTEEYVKLWEKQIPPSKGTCIYIDGLMYQADVPFKKEDKTVKKLIAARHSGKVWFEELLVIDAMGNKTSFKVSESARKLHMSVIGKIYRGVCYNGYPNGIQVVGILFEMDKKHNTAVLKSIDKNYTVQADTLERLSDATEIVNG